MAAPDRSRTAGRGASSSAKNKPKKKKVNIVRAGQRAVLNGRKVVADGRGNWRPVGGRDRTPVGTYTVGKDRTAPPKPTRNSAYTSDKIKKNRQSSEAKAKATASNIASRTKPTSTQTSSTKPTPTRPSSTKSTAKPARKPQSKDMDANYKAWAKANPKLAAKVKKGQSGYKALNSKPKPSSSTTASKPKPQPQSKANSRLSGLMAGTRGLRAGTKSGSSKSGSSKSPNKTKSNSRLSALLSGNRGLAASKKKKNK